MPQVSKITIGRLYNLGNFEHVRYEISVEVAQGESAEKTLIGLEKIVTALAPESKCCVKSKSELEREKRAMDELRDQVTELDEVEFRRRHGHFVGTPQEYFERCHQHYMDDLARRVSYEHRAKKARELLDSLGGTEVWKDAKLDWENDDNDF